MEGGRDAEIYLYYSSLYKCYDDAVARLMRMRIRTYILYSIPPSILYRHTPLLPSSPHDIIHTPQIRNDTPLPPPLEYTPSVVHLPHVHQLLSPRPGNLIRELLVAESLPRGFDDVHLVARAGGAGGEILEAGGTRELEDEVLDAESEACVLLEEIQSKGIRVQWVRETYQAAGRRAAPLWRPPSALGFRTSFCSRTARRGACS